MTKAAEYTARWRLRHPERKKQSDFNQRRRRGNQILSEYKDAVNLRVKQKMLGRTFGKLRVVAFGGRDKNGNYRWLCLCSCGRFTVNPCSQKLNSFHTRSCGCLGVEHCRKMGRRERPPKREGEELKRYWRDRNVVRRKTNPIEHRIRYRIWLALKSQKCRKAHHLIDLLGVTVDQFKHHLESLFEPWMSWENYGYRGWHIHHKIPCSKFDLSNPDEQKKCFHYTNMAPLHWRENISLGNRL